jgi:hypothetical protein
MSTNFIDELQRVIMDIKYEHEMMRKFEEVSLQDMEDMELIPDDEMDYVDPDEVERWEVARDKYGNIIGADPILYKRESFGLQ